MSKETAPARGNELGLSQVVRGTNGRATFIIGRSYRPCEALVNRDHFSRFSPAFRCSDLSLQEAAALVLSPALLHGLAQVLSAFRAVSADAIVECAAPTTFMLPPAAGWASTI